MIYALVVLGGGPKEGVSDILLAASGTRAEFDPLSCLEFLWIM